jgi:hypothetical protein
MYSRRRADWSIQLGYATGGGVPGNDGHVGNAGEIR